MKPTQKIGTAKFDDGSEMTLLRHDDDYVITINGQVLMSSRQHESEFELARLGCVRLTRRKDPIVLIGGLGMGYTLRRTLDLLGKKARVVVAELRPEVIRWNRAHIGKLTDYPLRDPRLTLRNTDVFELIRRAKGDYDAILLDLDNGPDAMAADINDTLYSREGIRACIDALKPGECLGVWSAAGDLQFERRMRKEHLEFRRFRVKAHKSGKAKCRTVWIASTDKRNLPEFVPKD
jgi:spermidine synthase